MIALPVGCKLSSSVSQEHTDAHSGKASHKPLHLGPSKKSSVVIATASIEAKLREGFLCVACVSHSGRTASHSRGLQRRDRDGHLKK